MTMKWEPESDKSNKCWLIIISLWLTVYYVKRVCFTGYSLNLRNYQCICSVLEKTNQEWLMHRAKSLLGKFFNASTLVEGKSHHQKCLSVVHK